jgi:hypothetical protein
MFVLQQHAVVSNVYDVVAVAAVNAPWSGPAPGYHQTQNNSTIHPPVYAAGSGLLLPARYVAAAQAML